MSHTYPESYSGPLSSGPRLSRRLSRKEGRRTSAPAWLVAASRRAQESVARVARMSPVSCLLSSWRAAAECEDQQLDPPAPGKAESLHQQRNVCIDPAFMRISDTEQGELLCKHIHKAMQ